MFRPDDIGIDDATFQRLRRRYRRTWDVDLCAMDIRGGIRFGRLPRACLDSAGCRDARSHALRESLRWGEPTVQFCPDKRVIWSVPLMRNAALLGGLLASAAEDRVVPDADGLKSLDVTQAAQDLLALAVEANLTNAALLDARRDDQLRERRRAETIHELKLQPHLGIREMFLREEPALLSAIRNDDRATARGILNRILVAMVHRAEGRLELIKSFFLELVVSMSRTAVEAGGSAEMLLGDGFRKLADLSAIANEEELAVWLHEMLEQILDTIRRHPRPPRAALAASALRYIEEHFTEAISRDDLAVALGISPSHCSRLLKRLLGRSFTDLLTQARIHHAAELLSQSDKPLAAVALECGFTDQSYFTKIFGRRTGQTPREYRLSHGHTTSLES